MDFGSGYPASVTTGLLIDSTFYRVVIASIVFLAVDYFLQGISPVVLIVKTALYLAAYLKMVAVYRPTDLLQLIDKTSVFFFFTLGLEHYLKSGFFGKVNRMHLYSQTAYAYGGTILLNLVHFS